MKSAPVVSVIIPTYNRAHTIVRAIRSINVQNCEDLEIIIVDDCSSDSTEPVVKRLFGDRVKYIRLDSNVGASGARNIGARVATGTFVAFLDSDDEWLVDMVEKSLAIFSSYPECDAVISGFIRYYKSSLEYISAPSCATTNSQLIAALLRNNYVSPQVLMLRRACFERIGGFDESLSHREDWDFGIRLLSGYNVKILNEPLALVYETPGNLSSMTVQKLNTLELLIHKHYSLFKSNPAALGRHYRYLGHLYMLSGCYVKGRKYIAASVFTAVSVKGLASLILSLLGGRVYSFLTAISRVMR
jgi:glycosyltransferase involved in cell wall biosynthesis